MACKTSSLFAAAHINIDERNVEFLAAFLLVNMQHTLVANGARRDEIYGADGAHEHHREERGQKIGQIADRIVHVEYFFECEQLK